MSGPLSDRALQRLLAMAAEDDPPRGAPVLPDRYDIVREIGRGGMGVVYEVIDRQLGRHVALKTLGAGADDELRARFVREATAAARLRHPHIAAVHDATTDYITMQLIEGGPLAGPPGLPPRQLVALVRDAALALQHAHEQGVVHRDVKPSNLLVEGDHVYVVDFGLAKTIDAASPLSLRGQLVGTPAFMPPEQARGEQDRIDARSDVYGLGATLHHGLTGSPPFAADDLPALLRRVVEDDPRPTGVDRDLDLVLGKCLAKEPDQRYASARELADDLERWLRDEPVRAARPSWFHRLRKRWRRQRAVWRAAGAAAVLAVGGTALVLVPAWLRESAAFDAAAEAVELADHVATVLQDSSLALSLGDRESSWHRLDAGIDRVRAFLARHEVPRVRYLLARLLQAHSRGEDALAELDRAIAADASLGDARFERGLLLAALPEPTAAQRSQAIADLGVGLGDRSVLRDVDRLFGKAELLRLQGDARRAMELLREVLEYDGMHVPARLSLAAAARARGDDALSFYYAASALDLQQGYGPFYLARERAALPTSMLDLRGMLVDFAADLKDAPDTTLGLAHRGLVHLRRALRLRGEGQLPAATDAVQAAIADHRTLLEVHGDLAGAHNNQAVCWLVAAQLCGEAKDAAGDQAALANARGELDAAIRLSPALAAAHGNRGLVALAANDAAGAVAEFTQALELAEPGWPHRAACSDHLATARALAKAKR